MGHDMKKWILLLLLIPTVVFADEKGWTPCSNSTVTMTVTDASGATRTALSATCGNNIKFSNTGTNDAFCEVTTDRDAATPTATTADIVVLANTYTVIKVPYPAVGGDRKVACICASGETATVYVETGTGSVD